MFVMFNFGVEKGGMPKNTTPTMTADETRKRAALIIRDARTRRSMMKNCTSGNFDVGGNFDGVGQLLNGNYALCTIMHHYA